MQGLLGLENLTRDELLDLLDAADRFVLDGRPHTPPQFRGALDGAAVALAFFEPSTRTRASFELAVQRLGGHPLVFDSTASSIRKGETEVDTCLNLQAMGVRGFIVRHADRHVPLRIADALAAPVINAGNGSGEHPTQGLLDALTIRHALRRRDLDGVRVAILGDIVHSRVARSDVYGLSTLGASVIVAGPAPLMPTSRKGWNAEFAESRADAVRDADIVIMLRIQHERIDGGGVPSDSYVRDWGVDETVVSTQMRPDVFIMHPGPVIRGVELTSGVADGPRSLVLQQTGFGVAVRQAVLMKLLVPEAIATT